MKSIMLSVVLLLSISVQAQRLEWAGGILSELDKEAKSIAVDKQGNVYAYGNYETLIDLDPAPLVVYDKWSVNGTVDLYLVKLDSAGNFLWGRSFGGYSDDMASKIAVDDSGNVLITGLIYGAVDFDPDTANAYYLGAAGVAQAFVLKLNTDGNFVWAKSVKGATVDDFAFGTSIHIDFWNNVYIGGVYSEVVDFDPDSTAVHLDSTIHSGGLFICKLSAAGEFKWVKTYRESNLDQVVSEITSDVNGYVYATGNAGGIDFPSSNIYGAFILKIDTAGNDIWDKAIEDQGSGTMVYSHTIGVDAAGSVYIGGSGWNPDFNPDPSVQHYLSRAGAFILKLNSNGEYVWVWNAAGESGSAGNHTYSLKISSSGFIHATGAFIDSTDFDNSLAVRKLYSRGSLDAFILKLDTARNLIWANSIGGLRVDRGIGLAINNEENIYTTGNFMKMIDLDPSDSMTYTIASPDWDNAYSIFNVYVQKLKNVSCSNLAVVIDSVENVTCANAGKIYTHGINSAGVTYQWNITPVQTTSTLTTTSPGMYTVSVTDDNGCISSATVFVFGPSNQQQGYDLNANLIAGEFRTGFNTYIQLDGLNERCAPVTGTLALVLDSLIQYDSASVTPSSMAGNTLIWNFTDLIYDSARVTPRVYITTALNAVAGNTVCFDLIMAPDTADADTTNNVKKYCYPVVNAYDPNYIAVNPKGECVEAYVQKSLPLTYTIHFQNTGNSHAVNVSLLDTLSASLDVRTVNLLAQSHDVITEVIDGNILKFRFDNIMLIDSATNADSSQGYVVYEIYPLSTTTDNTSVTNRAGIYFDFNAPVITNTVLNTLVTGAADSTYCDLEIGINEINGVNVSIYPNPTTGTFTLTADAGVIEVLYITDVAGRIVYSNKAVNSNIANVDMAQQATGLYFVAVKSKGITTKHKLLKY